MSPRSRLAGLCGLLVAVFVTVAYARLGYRPVFPWLLTGTVIVVGWSLRQSPEARLRSTSRTQDLIAVLVLLAIMAPIYWWRIYSVPWQINTDEVTIMASAQQMLFAPDTDLLGLSWYFGFPAAIFVAFAKLSHMIGGIDLYHFRVVHSCFGIGSALLAYALFRQFLTPIRAFLLAVLLGANHALFAISRMAMRDNTGLFLELLALLLLVRGLMQRSRAMTFMGGAVTGLTFYTYFPSRITLVLWMMVLAGVWVLRPRRRALLILAEFGGFALLGWAIVTAPVLIASAKHKDLAFGYQRQQFLFYPEGRLLEQQWTNAPTPEAAWTQNIKQGLETFNGKMHDQGYIYANYNHAFVDPATGALLWVGLIVAGVRLVRSKKPRLPDLLALTGFLVLYLAFALVITKAPNYTRLLVVLPFVVYLAGTGLWWLADLVSRGNQRVTAAIATVVVAVIVVLNVNIFREFADKGLKEGNDVGSTARFVEARNGVAGHVWILASDSTAPYYSWGNKWQWQTWLAFFTGPRQTARVMQLDSLEVIQVNGPTTILMQHRAWNFYAAKIREHNFIDTVLKVVPSGALVAVEVKGPKVP